MRERGDLDVLHEPFMYHHYLTRSDRLFTDFEPEGGHPTTYNDIRQMILERSRAGPLFFKDMAYYVEADLPQDPDFARAMTHAFLVRDPAESIVSYHRRDPDFTREELGHISQLKLYERLATQGHKPLVLTADQLRAAPEATLKRYWSHIGLAFVAHAFSWQPDMPKAWQPVAAWHDRAVASGRIEASDEQQDSRFALQQLGAPYTDYDRIHRPAYESLRQVALSQEEASGS